jgi:hypothetical protein
MGFMGKVCAALAASVLLSSQAAAGIFYECDTDSKEAFNWVSPKIGIVIDDAGTVTVIDNIIKLYFGNPIKAKARKNGDKLRITWRVANARDSKGERVPTFSYVANLNTKSKKLHVIAKPVGYPQRFSGKGVCKTHSK